VRLEKNGEHLADLYCLGDECDPDRIRSFTLNGFDLEEVAGFLRQTFGVEEWSHLELAGKQKKIFEKFRNEWPGGASTLPFGDWGESWLEKATLKRAQDAQRTPRRPIPTGFGDFHAFLIGGMTLGDIYGEDLEEELGEADKDEFAIPGVTVWRCYWKERDFFFEVETTDLEQSHVERLRGLLATERASRAEYLPQIREEVRGSLEAVLIAARFVGIRLIPDEDGPGEPGATFFYQSLVADAASTSAMPCPLHLEVPRSPDDEIEISLDG
jgi:hypothetical protein